MNQPTATMDNCLIAPRTRCHFHEEPTIRFGCEREHVSPQAGISLYGPRFVEDDQSHPATVRIGFIGSGTSIASAEQWMLDCAKGVSGDDLNRDFPGYQEDRGFYSKLVMPTKLRDKITTNEIQSIASNRHRRDRFDQSLDLVTEKINYLCENDQQPDVIVLALPDDLLKHCKTVDFKNKELGSVHQTSRS